MRVISSANGLAATRHAYELLAQGSDTLDAAVAAATVVEDDPNDHSVGYGGFPNAEGIVELDAAVMHGPTHRAGTVAALRGVRNAARAAQLVMERSDHVLLVGDGALQFARTQGLPEEDLLTEKARKTWQYWKEHLAKDGGWVIPPDTLLDADVARLQDRPSGTVYFSCLNTAGDISCAVSTSGLAFKIPGRAGDSAVIGAGLYVDNAIGSCGSTGKGEINQLNLSCYAAVELMRSGLSPADAGLEILRRVTARAHERHMRRPDGRPDFDLKLYLLCKDGSYAGVTIWGPAQFAVTDATGTRLEECVALYTK